MMKPKTNSATTSPWASCFCVSQERLLQNSPYASPTG